MPFLFNSPIRKRNSGLQRRIWVPSAGGATTHATTGALIGQGATVTCSAARAGAVTHATTGALVGQGATVAGTAVYNAKHTTTGTLTGQGATVIGSAVNGTVQQVAQERHGGGGFLSPVGNRKRTSGIRRELKRLFKKADEVVKRVEAEKKPAKQPAKQEEKQSQVVVRFQQFAPPINEIQALLAQLQAVQEYMNTVEMRRLEAIQQELQQAQLRMYNIRARAALLAA